MAYMSGVQFTVQLPNRAAFAGNEEASGLYTFFANSR
jgi:hypothetical protein